MSETSPTAAGEALSESRRERIIAIDVLRGFVIALMALDHSRDYFGHMRIPCEDAATTTMAFFFTRWVTHFCAPTFLFLAGMSACLYGQKLGSKKKLTDYLLTRGLWLLFLEFTVIYYGITLSNGSIPFAFLVIAAIGTSMICLSLASRLPTAWVLGLGILIISGHNLLDPITNDQFGSWDWLWMLVHGGPGYLPELNLEVAYPFLPWFGVMCLGYGMAPVFNWEPSKRRRVLSICGLGVMVGFLCLRSLNGYGNPQSWQWQPVVAASQSASDVSNAEISGVEETEAEDSVVNGDSEISYVRTMFSFLATRKYPPSLAYLLMTLGPAMLALALFDRLKSSDLFSQIFLVYGRVPLFFYITHFYLLHLASIATYALVRGVPLSPFQSVYQEELPAEYGFSTLWQVYLAWGLLLLVLYPLCQWYHRHCKRSNNPIWRYL